MFSPSQCKVRKDPVSLPASNFNKNNWRGAHFLKRKELHRLIIMCAWPNIYFKAEHAACVNIHQSDKYYFIYPRVSNGLGSQWQKKHQNSSSTTSVLTEPNLTPFNVSAFKITIVQTVE